MKYFAVIGLGRFGSRLACVLTEAGAEVIAIDTDRDLIERIRDEVTLAVRMDATDADALRAQGVDKVDCAIVGIGTAFEAAALAVSTLKAIGVPRVIARAGSGNRGTILERIGADDIIFPERESATRWANRLMLPKLKDYVELGEDHAMVQIQTPEAFVHKTPADLALRRKYHVNLVAIRRQSEAATTTGKAGPEAFIIPTAETEILANDTLIILGADEDVAALPTE